MWCYINRLQCKRIGRNFSYCWFMCVCTQALHCITKITIMFNVWEKTEWIPQQLCLLYIFIRSRSRPENIHAYIIIWSIKYLKFCRNFEPKGSKTNHIQHRNSFLLYSVRSATNCSFFLSYYGFYSEFFYTDGKILDLWHQLWHIVNIWSISRLGINVRKTKRFNNDSLRQNRMRENEVSSVHVYTALADTSFNWLH